MTSIARLVLLAVLLPASASAAGGQEPGDFARLVEQVERARGLAFRRAPGLTVVESRDAFRNGAARIPNAIAIECPTAGFEVRRVETAAADTRSDRVLAAPGASVSDIGVALAHLLDTQHYPALVQQAAHRTGDAGIAQRGLLAASACTAAQGGFGDPPPPTEPADDPFPDALLAVEATESGARLIASATSVAATFLKRLPDREAAFRRPPLSTLELLVPGRWEASATLELTGAPPTPEGCSVEDDASLGVLRMMSELVARGGSVPRGAFVGWRGDRLVRFVCEDGRAPWVFVAQLERARDAEDLRRVLESVLPEDLERPFSAHAARRRVAAWQGLEDAAAEAYAGALQTRALR